MGNKPLRDVKATSVINIRVTPEDKEQLLALARDAGLPLSRYMIDTLLSAPNRC